MKGYTVVLIDAEHRKEAWNIAPAPSAPAALREALKQWPHESRPTHFELDEYELPRVSHITPTLDIPGSPGDTGSQQPFTRDAEFAGARREDGGETDG